MSFSGALLGPVDHLFRRPLKVRFHSPPSLPRRRVKTHVPLIVETSRCSLRAGVVLAVSHVSPTGGEFPSVSALLVSFPGAGTLVLHFNLGPNTASSTHPPLHVPIHTHTRTRSICITITLARAIATGSPKSRLKLPVWKLKWFPKVGK